VLIATAIQAWSSAVERGRANGEAVDWWNADDELVASEPPFRRRRARRFLVAERDEGLHPEIRRLQWTLGSWAALMVASGAAFMESAL
jgi:hypothetical protein